MSEIKQIELEIVRNLEIINNATEQNNKLRSELEQLELTNWSPDIGEFIVETTGKIFNKLDSGFCRELYSSGIQDLESDFGSVRTTQKRAEMASDNMKRFNRLSCFMEDSTPILEYSPISVALVFYDYDMDKIEKLTKIIKSRGEL